MSATQQIRQDLFRYFEARGVVAGHLINATDFTVHMTPGYSPEMHAAIAPAFQQLVAEGVFEEKSPGEYLLTAKGLDLLREDRVQNAV